MPVKTIPLKDGSAIPWVAFGTGTALLDLDCTASAARALMLGFTHLDCSQLYKNEVFLGTAIAQSGVARDKLFITTKLGPVPTGKSVEDTLRESLERLRIEHVDLFLVHIPTQHYEREGGIRQVWREMVGVKAKGLARSIGVSNFNKALLEEIVSLGLEKPVVNQIEYHLLVVKRLAPLLAYMREQGIVAESYAGLTPILSQRVSRAGDSTVAPESVRMQITPTLDKLAAARGAAVTHNQILLKWLQAEGVIAVTTSSKESRLKEYLAAEALCDLTPEEKEELEDATGGAHFRAFKTFSHMDEN